MLYIIDEFTRESLAIRVARKLKATDVIEALCDLFVTRGIAEHAQVRVAHLGKAPFPYAVGRISHASLAREPV
jgi:hypothetical protein